MANSLLERTRSTFDQIEALDRLVISELKNDTKTKRDQAIQSCKLNSYLSGSVERSKDVLTILEDSDGFRKDEIAQMAGVNVFKVFYDKLLEIKQYHRRFPNRQQPRDFTVPMQDETAEMLKRLYAPETEKISSKFSGEESYGKYLDLHGFYVRFMNLKRAKPSAAAAADDDMDGEGQSRPTYRQFLDDFFQFDDHAAMAAGQDTLQKGPEYLAYLKDLVASFRSFCIRTDPLLQETLEAEFKKWEDDFEARSTDNMWAAFESHSGYLSLKSHATAASLEALGADRLKAALQALGLKCGGSLTQRAQRLFSLKGLSSLDEINPSMLAGRPKKRRRKSRKAKTAAQDVAAKKKAGELLQSVVRCEHLVTKYVAKLRDTLEVTKRTVEQKQIRTWEELEMEMQEEEEAEQMMHNGSDDDDDDDDDEVPYNPKNIPLGWDGKPIPYWLYKLHGLGVDYPCEICGEHVYKGRRAFDRHFQEWRHAHGMRCLGIPNTKHFHDITLIQDAQNLYKKIKSQIRTRSLQRR